MKHFTLKLIRVKKIMKSYNTARKKTTCTTCVADIEHDICTLNVL